MYNNQRFKRSAKRPLPYAKQRDLFVEDICSFDMLTLTRMTGILPRKAEYTLAIVRFPPSTTTVTTGTKYEQNKVWKSFDEMVLF